MQPRRTHKLSTSIARETQMHLKCSMSPQATQASGCICVSPAMEVSSFASAGGSRRAD